MTNINNISSHILNKLLNSKAFSILKLSRNNLKPSYGSFSVHFGDSDILSFSAYSDPKYNVDYYKFGVLSIIYSGTDLDLAYESLETKLLCEAL